MPNPPPPRQLPSLPPITPPRHKFTNVLSLPPFQNFQIAQSDLQAQARLTAASLAENIQTGTRGAAEQLNKFIEGGNNDTSSSAARGAATTTTTTTTATRGRRAGGEAGVEPDRRDFWDSFGEDKAGAGGGGGILGGAGHMASRGGGGGSAAIGTAAMKKGTLTNNPPAAPPRGGTSQGKPSTAPGANDDGWEDW